LEIILKYSPFLVLPIFLLAIAFSFLLYSSKKHSDLPVKLRIFLGFIRFLVFFLVGIFLLSPLLKAYVKEIKRPTILLAIDNSNSVVYGEDNVSNSTNIKQFITDFNNKVGDKFDILTYSFGSKVELVDSLNFKNQTTNISSAIGSLNQQNRHRNIGGMIIVSDGIFNSGENPVYEVEKLSYPIYSLGLGDTNHYKDLSINRLVSNEMVFTGDKFPVLVDIKAVKSKGYTSKLKLFFDDKKIDEKIINIKSDYELFSFNFLLVADKPGVKKIVVQSEIIDGEINRLNNTSEFYVEVIDSRQKVLIAYQAPHPDIAILTRIIQSSNNYIVEQKNINAISDLESYNLLILHGLPAGSNDFLQLKNKMAQSKIPFLLIGNSTINLNFFNTLSTGVSLVSPKSSVQQILPILNENFNSFIISDDLINLFPDLSPIEIPYATYKGSENMDVVLYQKIGNVQTQFPLLFLNQNAEVKKGVLLGDGIWRWWFIAQQSDENVLALDDLVLNLIRTLSLKVNKERFSIQYENIYSGNDEIQLRALVYNSSYQSIIEPEVNLQLFNINTSTKFEYTFSKSEDSYFLNLGLLPAGKYSFIATVQIDKQDFKKAGQFFVQDLNRELSNLEANHLLLNQLSNATEGRFWTGLQTDSLISHLDARSDLVSVESKLLKYTDLIDFRYLLFFIVLLIAFEWFIRKYLGIY
jgi:hypothetical protein